MPDNNILGVAPGAVGSAAGDGYYVLLRPLSVGEHTLRFGGTADLSPIGGPTFIQDISYTITVVPPETE